jgi:hypothetical protein
MMMGWGVMLSEVVSYILDSWCPIDAKVSLLGTIPYPVKVHINGFGQPDLFYCSVHDSACVELSVSMGVAGCGCPIS